MNISNGDIIIKFDYFKLILANYSFNIIWIFLDYTSM